MACAWHFGRVAADQCHRGHEPASELVVREIMNQHPECIGVSASVREAGELLALTAVSDLMVVGDDGSFVGVLLEVHLLRAMLPNREEVLAAGGSVSDGFIAFETKARSIAVRSIAPYIITEPLTLHPGEHVAAAAAALVNRQIRRVPVVDDGQLVGAVSAANICRAAFCQRGRS